MAEIKTCYVKYGKDTTLCGRYTYPWQSPSNSAYMGFKWDSDPHKTTCPVCIRRDK